MDATIPTGRAARTAWRRLDRSTKREVLQRAAEDQGHPDPTVAAVAVGFARWERAYSGWVSIVMALGPVVVAGVLDWLLSGLPLLTACALAFGVAVWRGRKSGRRLMERMERVNLAVLRDDGRTSGPVEDRG
jgi:hypothetical protein